MPEALSFAEIDQQHIELLPARTVMSALMTDDSTGQGGKTADTGTSQGTSAADLLKQAMDLVGKLAPAPK